MQDQLDDADDADDVKSAVIELIMSKAAVAAARPPLVYGHIAMFVLNSKLELISLNYNLFSIRNWFLIFRKSFPEKYEIFFAKSKESFHLRI